MEYSWFFVGEVVLLGLLGLSARRLARGRAFAWRSRLVNGALVLMAVVAPLTVAEGVFLFFVDTTDGALATLTSRRWRQRHLPARGGYRGRLRPSPRSGPGPGLSVAVLGDSITYGQGIAREEDLYPSLLEGSLRRRGVQANVLNVSAPGWNAPEETAALQRVFDSGCEFDVVVLGFCLNDMAACVPPPPGFAEELRRRTTPPALLAPLCRRSFVASFLYYRYTELNSSAIRASWGMIEDAYESNDSFIALVAGIQKLRRLVESHGARLVVATFPDTSAPWDEYRFRAFHRKFDEYWRKAGVTHVDLLPVLERHPPRLLRVGIMDSHPNELVHRLTAAALVDALERLLGLPQLPAAVQPQVGVRGRTARS